MMGNSPPGVKGNIWLSLGSVSFEHDRGCFHFNIFSLVPGHFIPGTVSHEGDAEVERTGQSVSGLREQVA